MRRTKPINREVPPDFRYQNVTVQSFINHIMTRGKKSTASRCVYGAFEIVQEKTGKNPIEVFDLALKNVGPMMEVRPRRVGGATYQVPMEVPTDRHRFGSSPHRQLVFREALGRVYGCCR
jgi:small subunit ribosomal protein S7